jgi:hypothetical protein
LAILDSYDGNLYLCFWIHWTNFESIFTSVYMSVGIVKGFCTRKADTESGIWKSDGREAVHIECVRGPGGKTFTIRKLLVKHA